MTLNYSFIGYVPPFRCKVDACDGGGGNFNDILHFTTPDLGEGNYDGCKVFQFKGSFENSTYCQARYFNPNSSVSCNRSQYVYDHTQFDLTFTEDLNIPPCGDSHWTLDVRL